jgi:hypothetical protein
LRRALLRAFTEADWRELREDYGATEAMLEELRSSRPTTPTSETW